MTVLLRQRELHRSSVGKYWEKAMTYSDSLSTLMKGLNSSSSPIVDGTVDFLSLCCCCTHVSFLTSTSFLGAQWVQTQGSSEYTVTKERLGFKKNLCMLHKEGKLINLHCIHSFKVCSQSSCPRWHNKHFWHHDLCSSVNLISRNPLESVSQT
jgi:hypothetical protein